MIPNFQNFQNSSNKNRQGSSFLSPVHGCGGARATPEFNSNPSAKKSGEARWGRESVSAIPAKAGRQNRKIFVSSIEKNLGGVRIKNCKENFSVLPAVRRTETLGGNQSAKSSGFCSKKVRISSNKHH